MAQIPTKYIKILAITSGLLLLAVLFFFLRDTDRSSRPSPSTTAKGFTFLDLHADSILTESIKNRLEKNLGSVAVENNTVLDLELHYPGFLEKYFPDLNELNKKLNFEGGRRIRIEHNTIKLIYRFSTTFNYVELFFSNYSQKPLLFRIKAKRDGMDYLTTLRQKYGDPQTIAWQDQKGKSLFWTRDKDVLILSLFADQYDQPQFEIIICHVENIENLLTAEKKESRRQNSEKGMEGRKLF